MAKLKDIKCDILRNFQKMCPGLKLMRFFARRFVLYETNRKIYLGKGSVLHSPPVDDNSLWQLWSSQYTHIEEMQSIKAKGRNECLQQTRQGQTLLAQCTICTCMNHEHVTKRQRRKFFCHKKINFQQTKPIWVQGPRIQVSCSLTSYDFLCLFLCPHITTTYRHLTIVLSPEKS